MTSPIQQILACCMALQIPFLLLTFREQGVIIACYCLKIFFWLEVESRESILAGKKKGRKHQKTSRGMFSNLWSTEMCLLSVC